MSLKIPGGMGPGGGMNPTAAGGPARPSEPADRLSRAPDPSKAFLPPSPMAPHRGPEGKAGSSVELERRSGPALYQSSHFEDPSSFMRKEDIELAKRLCHRMDASHWPALYAAFQAELKAARSAREADPSSGRILAPDWWTDPWYYVGADLDVALLDARPLGFQNVALMGRGAYEGLAARGLPDRAKDLRLTKQLDLGSADVDLSDASWLARVLRTLAEELRHGLGGVRTHGIDRLAKQNTERGHARDAGHAFQALLKLYLRSLDPTQVLVPELIDATDHAGEHAGGALELPGVHAASEGDLIHWHEGMAALQDALIHERRASLDEALSALPLLIHGARRMCSLEHHDGEASLLELVGWSPERLSLAFALLYFLPATPAIYAKSARALPAGRTALRRLNRLRRGHEALRAADLYAVSPDQGPGVFWCRGRAADPHGALILAANLSDRGLALTVPRKRLMEAGLLEDEGLRALGRARERGRLHGAGLEIELPPFGTALFAA